MHAAVIQNFEGYETYLGRKTMLAPTYLFSLRNFLLSKRRVERNFKKIFDYNTFIALYCDCLNGPIN